MTQTVAQHRELAPPPGQPTPGHAIARSAFHLVMGQAVMTALAIGLSAAQGRWLGPSDYGVLYLVSTIVAFAAVIVDWGQSYYVVGQVASHPERTGLLLGTSMALRVATTVLMVVLTTGLVTVLGYDGRTRGFTALYVALNLPTLLAGVYSLVFRGMERMDYSAAADVASRLLATTLSVMVLWLGGRLLGVILVQGAAGLGALAVAVYLYRRLRLQRMRAVAGAARELLRGGAPMLAMSLAIAILPNIDAILLSKLAPAQAVGWYGAARNFMGVLVAPAAILGTAAFPRLSRAKGNMGQFRHELRTALRPLLVLGALGAVGTYFFADLAVTLVYGKTRYGPAIPILQLFAPVMLLVYTDMLFGGAIMAAGKSRFFAVAKVLAVLLGSLLDYLLIPICQARYGNGGMGVILSFCTAELVMVVASLIILPRGALDRSSVLDMVRAVAAASLTLLAVRALPALPQLVELPLCLVVFAVAAVLLGLVRRRDLELLQGVLTRKSSGSTP